jgi:polyisoprenoid-binding protein YceI
LTLPTFGQQYVPQDAGSKVHFIVKNFGINTGGDLTGLQGEISFAPNQIANSTFDVTVSTKTIDTDNSQRDESLIGKDYFDVKTYPEIRITSTKISATNKTSTGYYYFTGNLTIKGITQPISFPFQVEKIKEDYLFTGEFEINRLLFGVGEKSMVLGNTVKIQLKVLAKHQ